jgi:3-methyladenine DNA glycosylase/8-oxoguanine DNA glycosylase
MCINEEKNKPLKLREETIEEVDEFTYLGSIIAKKNGTTKDAEKRINKVRSAFGRLNKIWRSNILPVKTKLIVFNHGGQRNG